jgi:hypothetical protein
VLPVVAVPSPKPKDKAPTTLTLKQDSRANLKHFRELIKNIVLRASPSGKSGAVKTNDTCEASSDRAQVSSPVEDDVKFGDAVDAKKLILHEPETIETTKVFVNASGFVNWRSLDVSSEQTAGGLTVEQALLFVGAAGLQRQTTCYEPAGGDNHAAVDEISQAVDEWVVQLTGKRSAYLKDLLGSPPPGTAVHCTAHANPPLCLRQHLRRCHRRSPLLAAPRLCKDAATLLCAAATTAGRYDYPVLLTRRRQVIALAAPP